MGILQALKIAPVLGGSGSRIRGPMNDDITDWLCTLDARARILIDGKEIDFDLRFLCHEASLWVML